MNVESDAALVLLSGGMDSVTLLHYVCKRLQYPRIHALSFLYGQKHSRELNSATWQAQDAGVDEHCVLDLVGMKGLLQGASALTDERIAVPDMTALPKRDRDQPITYVPNRNMMLLAMAAACAEARGIVDVFYGAQKQDAYGYWDCTPAFLKRINDLLALNRRRPVTVHAPFMNLRKSDELRTGIELGVDYAHTWTCYRGQVTACGTCPACAERLKAFQEVGVPDPLPYEPLT